MKVECDFYYNSIPVFNVNLWDFHMFYDCLEHNKRILSRNIINENLQSFYKQCRDNNFIINYEGIMLDIKNFKKL